MTNKQHPLSYLKDLILKNNTIPEQYYPQFEVKRGLRNSDGSGVLAGLTSISSVVGSKKIDYQSISIEGDLKLRGESIFDLVSKHKSKKNDLFESISFLILIGKTPSDDDLKKFKEEIAKERVVPNDVMEHIIKGISSKNMMNKLLTSISGLYASDSDADSLDPFENVKKSISVIAKMPMIIAYSYLQEFKKNPKFVEPPKEMTQAEAFLYVLNEGKPGAALEVELMDLALALHAEHGGGNNSTFTNHVVTSSGTDIYSSVAASIASLKGPLHGSANQKVMEMMDNIKSNVKDWENKEEVKQYLIKIINKEAHDKSGKIYGLGHAVYTKSDPRGVILKQKAVDLAKMKHREKELQLYLNIEELGPKAFSEIKESDKVIAPNVDFFSGYVYDCLGIPQEIYTPIFAMARVVGWCAHRIEEILSGKRIIRPGYKYLKID